MANLDNQRASLATRVKQRAKLAERILALETELRLSLQKKTAGKAIDVPGYTRKIQDLKLQLMQLD